MSFRDLEGEKILLVDDEEEICGILADSFELTGAEVIVAHDGKEALKIALETPSISIIITDIRMPIMDGKELTESLRNKGIKIPIICMSGDTGSDRADILAWGANIFIPKPANMNRMFEAIYSLTSGKND